MQKEYNVELTTKKVEMNVTIPLTPQDVAKLWCDMDNDGQAKFFNEIHRIATEEWSGTLAQQMAWVRDCDELTGGGRSVMQMIGEHSHKE